MKRIFQQSASGLTSDRVLKLLRVPLEDEEIGMDIIKHGEAAYPVSAWREYQYRIHGPLCQSQNQTKGVRQSTQSSDSPQVSRVSTAIAKSVSVLNNNLKSGQEEVSGGNNNAGLELSDETAEMIEMSEKNEESQT